MFGLTPLFGNNIWLNALNAGIAFYYGFVKSGEITMQSSSSAQAIAFLRKMRYNITNLNVVKNIEVQNVIQL
ncbi:hypothetical protein QUA04_29490 [Microcoleus sp. S13_C5]